VKIKILAVAVAGMLLSGCSNDDNGSFPALSVQAYDPAIQNMDASVSCEDGTTETGKTGFDGKANFTSLTVISAPETCKFTFTGNADSVDVSNGKPMNGVTYIIPEGMASRDASANTASPITTLIAKKLGGAPYTPEVAAEVMVELGFGDLINNGTIDVTEFLLNTESVLNDLKDDATSQAAFSQLSAATAVLSDVLKANPDATPEEVGSMAAASVTLTEEVLAANPGYPAGGLDGEGAPVVIAFEEDVLVEFVDNIINDILDSSLPKITFPDAVPKIDPDTPTGGSDGGQASLGA
jgi:hypothetical protein